MARVLLVARHDDAVARVGANIIFTFYDAGKS